MDGTEEFRIDEYNDNEEVEEMEKVIKKMEKIQIRWKNQVRKLVISLAVGVLGMVAMNVFSSVYPEKVESFLQREKEPEQMTAWWGTLYPKFCFSDIPEEAEGKDIKISFWLARVLNW